MAEIKRIMICIVAFHREYRYVDSHTIAIKVCYLRAAVAQKRSIILLAKVNEELPTMPEDLLGRDAELLS